jgi:hypothetical protein
MSNLNLAVSIVSAHTDGSTRDQIIINLHTEHGLSLNAATRLYADTAKAEGWTSATVSHKESALAYLRDRYEASTWDSTAVSEMVIELSSEYEVAESTARDYTKAFSKAINVAHPTTDPRTLMFQYLIDNASDMAYDDLKAGFKTYATDLGRSASNINEYWKGYDLHLALVAAK